MDAVRFYFEGARDCVNSICASGFVGGEEGGDDVPPLLGNRVRIWREGVNYPQMGYLMGVVRNYSLWMKRWLVVYDHGGSGDGGRVGGMRYGSSWINVCAEECGYTILDDCGYDISGGSSMESEDHNQITEIPPMKDNLNLVPFWFSPNKDTNEEDIYDKRMIDNTVSTSQITNILTTHCRACINECTNTPKGNTSNMHLKCNKCSGLYHPHFLDPPLSTCIVDTILNSGEPWTCHKCVRCMGCCELDIVFGIRTVPAALVPPSLFLEKGQSLDLCVRCLPLYEKEMFCPVCAHTWDDKRYQKVRRRLRWRKRNVGRKKGVGDCLMTSECDRDVSEDDIATKDTSL